MPMYEPGGHPKLALILLQLHAKRELVRTREATAQRSPADEQAETRLGQTMDEVDALVDEAKAEIFRLTEVPFDLIQEANL